MPFVAAWSNAVRLWMPLLKSSKWGNAKTRGADSQQHVFDVYFSVTDKFNFKSVFHWRFTRLCFSRCVLVGDYIIWLLLG